MSKGTYWLAYWGEIDNRVGTAWMVIDKMRIAQQEQITNQ